MGTLASMCNDKPYEKIVSLFKAIRHNNFKRAKIIMSSGIDINCINYSGATPLIETCRCRYLPQTQIEREEFVQFLIHMGCDIKRIDIHGRTALLYAEMNGHDTIVELLDRYENRKKKPDFVYELETIAEEDIKEGIKEKAYTVIDIDYMQHDEDHYSCENSKRLL